VVAGEKNLRWGCIIFGIFNSLVTMGLLALWHALLLDIRQASTLLSIKKPLKNLNITLQLTIFKGSMTCLYLYALMLASALLWIL